MTRRGGGKGGREEIEGSGERDGDEVGKEVPWSTVRKLVREGVGLEHSTNEEDISVSMGKLRRRVLVQCPHGGGNGGGSADLCIKSDQKAL